MASHREPEIRAAHERDLATCGDIDELLRACGWRPPAGFRIPPKHPRR